MFRKLYYKLFKSKNSYNQLKIDNIKQKQILIFEEKLKEKLSEIDKVIKKKKELNFLHSGHCGDLIYSLSIVKKLSTTHKCNFYVGINKKIPDEDYFKHPANKVYIDDRMCNLLLPLLKQQNFIKHAKKHENETIDVDLDTFRDFPINLSFNSCKWYFHLIGEQSDLSKPYLECPEHKNLKDNIVILRSFRARNHFINYKFLQNCNYDLIFIGLENEYEDLKKDVPKLKFYEPSDFFEMGQIIKSSKFFLGNQSIAFAIAEGLKIPRLLECRPDFPVVQPLGGECYEFYYQIHFEKWFNHLTK